jgi:hypothetical protein
MNTLATLQHICKMSENEYIVTQSHSADDCNEYEFFDKNRVKMCYIIEFFENPITNEKLDHTVFELYCENENTTSDSEDDDFIASFVYDDFDDLENDLLDILEIQN